MTLHLSSSVYDLLGNSAMNGFLNIEMHHMLYSRDHKGVGMAHEIIPPKKQPQFPLTMMRQYWLGKTKPKQAFRLTRNAFSKLLQDF